MHASIQDRFPLKTRERNWDVPRVLISMKFFAFNRGLHSPIDTFLLFVSVPCAILSRSTLSRCIRHPTVRLASHLHSIATLTLRVFDFRGLDISKKGGETARGQNENSHKLRVTYSFLPVKMHSVRLFISRCICIQSRYPYSWLS